MNSSDLFRDTVARINDLAADLDAKKRCYIFLDWNPLYSETNTTESMFWRECINIHILFRECMPGMWNNDDKNDFLQDIGFTERDCTRFDRFICFLRNMRLYYCHMVNDDLSVNRERQDWIDKGFRTYFGVDPDVKNGWQFRMEEEDWQTALERLYDHTKTWLELVENCLSNRISNTQKAFDNWKKLYGAWFSSDDMCRNYLREGFIQYYNLLDDQNTHPSQKPAKQRAGEAMGNDEWKNAIRNRYIYMDTVPNVNSFEPAQLTLAIIKDFFNN